MTLLTVLQHHLQGGKFEYLSLNYHTAIEEFKTTDAYKNYGDRYFDQSNTKLGMWSIPEEIRKKHAHWKSGKLRSIEFSPSGSIYRIYLGSKYKRAFYESNIQQLKLIPLS